MLLIYFLAIKKAPQIAGLSNSKKLIMAVILDQLCVQFRYYIECQE